MALDYATTARNMHHTNQLGTYERSRAGQRCSPRWNEAKIQPRLSSRRETEPFRSRRFPLSRCRAAGGARVKSHRRKVETRRLALDEAEGGTARDARSRELAF